MVTFGMILFQLVVHVGVSGIASELTLEQQAHNDGYCKEDVKQQCPSHTCCVHGSQNTIISNIDMQTVCDEVNRSSCGVKAAVSHDPGRYVFQAKQVLIVETPAHFQPLKPLEPWKDHVREHNQTHISWDLHVEAQTPNTLPYSSSRES